LKYKKEIKVEINKGYKLVRKIDNKYYSAIVYDSSGCVNYIKNKWTKPNYNCGYLAIFQDLVSINLFFTTNRTKLVKDKYCIFECEYEEACYEKTMKDNMYFYDKYNGLRVLIKDNFPYGTILAKRIKLIKKISYKEYIKRSKFIPV
jgi:hypothetical protein